MDLQKLFRRESHKEKDEMCTKLCERPNNLSQHVRARYPGVLALPLEGEICV